MNLVKILLGILFAALCANAGVKGYTSNHASEKFGGGLVTLLREKGFIDRIEGRSNPRSSEDTAADAGIGDVLDNPRVNTTSGDVVGITTQSAHAFYEIPFAEPPIGSLRFQEPQPIRSRIPEINATHNTQIHCHQSCSDNVMFGCSDNGDEDCLVLNVFVPRSIQLSNVAGADNEQLLPVMFFIHGGSFKFGSGTSSYADGQELANVTNSVVVVPNYRLGAFGFLVHHETGREDITGNQGLKDQRLALIWVQDNIAQFGGDETRVMIFGNSAGAQSVMFHTISEQSSTLFSSSIQQSNPHIYSFFYPDVNASLRIADRLIQALGCNISIVTERECLLNASAGDITRLTPRVETLTAAQEGNSVYSEETFMPVIDGFEYSDQPEKLYRDGKWSKDKPMIIGVLTEELDDIRFTISKDVVFGEDQFLRFNQQIYGSHLANIIVSKYKEVYPPREGEDFRAVYGKEASHTYFDCPNRLMARYASNTTNSTVYFYADSHGTVEPTCVLQNGGNTTGCRLAYHASELRYLFRKVDYQDNDYAEQDRIIEDQFSTYWGSFALTGVPSNDLEITLGNFSDWAEYKAASSEPWGHLLITTPNSKMEFGYKEDICDFWDKINHGRIQIPNVSTTPKGEPTTLGNESTGLKSEPTTAGNESTTSKEESPFTQAVATTRGVDPTTSLASSLRFSFLSVAVSLGCALMRFEDMV